MSQGASKELELKYLLYEDGEYFTTDAIRRRYPDSELVHMIQNLGSPISQGYLPMSAGRVLARDLGMGLDEHVVEARLRSYGEKFFFTLKSDGTVERTKQECYLDECRFNLFWPLTEGKRISKLRMRMPLGKDIAEIDYYTDGRELIVAEVEVPTMERLLQVVPLGKDITHISAYKNKNLAK